MSIYLERAKELRAIEIPHYNCAQSVLIPFAEKAGLDPELAYGLAAGFGAGMHTGRVCGAATGAIMALGLYGEGDGETVSRFLEDMAATHGDTVLCAELLAGNEAAGGDRHRFCDGLVYEAISLVEKVLAERGKLA